jgi:hypothetical protein
VLGAAVPPDKRPARWLVVASVVCIALQAAFALGYLFVSYG